MSNIGTKITGNQRSAIFALYAALGIHDRERRADIQRSVTGVESLTKFTRTDATKLIKHLKGLNGEDPERGWVEHRPKAPRAAWTPAENDPDAPPTAEQLEHLTQLREQLGATPAQWRKWIIRQTQKAADGPANFPRRVSEAQKLISGARAMVNQGYDGFREKIVSE